MIVYRIAQEDVHHPYPVGPYQWTDPNFRHPEALSDMCSAHRDSDHPIPSMEGHWMEADDLCGFTDVYRLMKWFDGYLDMLHDHGFMVYEYECPDDTVVDLAKQSVFRNTWATLVRHYPISCRERQPIKPRVDKGKDWRNLPVWAVLMLDANSPDWRNDFQNFTEGYSSRMGEGYIYVNLSNGYYVVDQYYNDTSFYWA